MTSKRDIQASELGSIFVRLDKDGYIPGEQVSGVVLLDLKSNHDEPEVWLNIRGFEEVKLVDVHANKKGLHSSSLMNVYEDDQEFFCNKLAVYTFAGGFIPAGQYTFPFAFVLQAGLPSSFDCPIDVGEDESFGRVAYELAASLESLHGNQVRLRYSTKLPVNHALDLKAGSTSQEISYPVFSCFCIQQGMMDVSAYLEKDKYFAGDNIVLVTSVDNSESKVAVECIDVHINQELVAKAQGFKHTVKREISRFSFSGFKAGVAKIGDDALKLNIPLKAPEAGSSLPGQLLPTTSSKRVSNKYTVSVIVRMEGCQLPFKQPHLELALNVASRGDVHQVWVQQPPTWNPQVMHAATLQLMKSTSLDTKEEEYSPKNFSQRPDRDIKCPVLHDFRN